MSKGCVDAGMKLPYTSLESAERFGETADSLGNWGSRRMSAFNKRVVESKLVDFRSANLGGTIARQWCTCAKSHHQFLRKTLSS